MNKHTILKKQDGAALVVSLILLVVITILAISGMNTATTELAMARNDQNYENAFQAAESGLAAALGQNGFNTLPGPAVTQTITTHESVTTQITFEDSTLVPDRAFSLGAGSGIAAYHFLATAQSASMRDPGNPTDRDSTAVHTQAFYTVGPSSPIL
ncbi:MAG: pilus assembly PilX N-terminal domain-containing protein [Proteobacteria bacterium]|nr:pilus assembly PilX N-terminal domain-containing protein [Pseudomonadota bacterium]